MRDGAEIGWCFGDSGTGYLMSWRNRPHGCLCLRLTQGLPWRIEDRGPFFSSVYLSSLWNSTGHFRVLRPTESGKMSKGPFRPTGRSLTINTRSDRAPSHVCWYWTPSDVYF